MTNVIVAQKTAVSSATIDVFLHFSRFFVVLTILAKNIRDSFARINQTVISRIDRTDHVCIFRALSLGLIRALSLWPFRCVRAALAADPMLWLDAYRKNVLIMTEHTIITDY